MVSGLQGKWVMPPKEPCIGRQHWGYPVGGDPAGGDPVGGDPVGGDPVGGDPGESHGYSS